MHQSESHSPYLTQRSHHAVHWPDIQAHLQATIERQPLTIAQCKTCIDRLIVILSLPLVLPLCLIIALAIRLESKGPVFFLQERTGRHAIPFMIYKFRTMTDDACKQDDRVVQSQKKDLRHTRVGRFLRRLSLDELPQLINVLKGDMSLIGPRPHARYHDELFLAIDADYARRFRVKPGLTGWAQVHHCRGLIEDSQQVLRRTSYDNDYIDTWSIRKEITIIFKTILIVLGGDNM